MGELLSVCLGGFLALPLPLRAGVVVLLLFVGWLLLGRGILFVLSAVPLALKWLFWGLYLILEYLAALVHKLLGGSFYRISNGLTGFGERTTAQLTRWYDSWHSPQRRDVRLAALMFCGLCYAAVVLPGLVQAEEDSWKYGGTAAYLKTESRFVRWLTEQSWYAAVPALNPAEDENRNYGQLPQVSMTVVHAPRALRVRNIPSTSGAETLETLKNGDVVLWSGELAFGMAEGEQEAWVKVTTSSGIEGWSRLYFLQPEENAKTAFFLLEQIIPS